MQWIAHSEKDNASATCEKRFWAALDQLRDNSGKKDSTLKHQIQNLLRTRGLLLPCLLAGQIENLVCPAE